MKGSNARSELFAGSQGWGWGLTASIATCANNLDGLVTSVCRKPFKVGISTEGIKTPSQIIVIEVQLICNEEDVHAQVRPDNSE